MPLPFPLPQNDQETIEKSLETSGEIKLVNGQAVVYDVRIVAGKSIGFANHKTFEGTIGILRVECQNGQAIIQSSSSSDVSRVYYTIKFRNY